jgi:hypothetical protein
MVNGDLIRILRTRKASGGLALPRLSCVGPFAEHAGGDVPSTV